MAPAPAAWSRPVWMVLGAVALFATSDIFAKTLTRTLPAPQVVWMRYLMFFALAALLVARARAGAASHCPRLQLFRAGALLGSATLFMLGLGKLGVAEATAVSFVTPAFITVLSVFVLKETVGLRRWVAVALGLAGVLVVLRPGAGAFQPAAVFPLASAICGAVMVVVTRRIGTAERTEITLLWSSGFGLALLSLSAPLWLTAMGWREVGFAAAMAALYAGGQLLLVLAYGRGEASALAPFSYAQIVIATALAGLVFGVTPDAISLVGMALIVFSGAYTLYRERVASRLRAWRRRLRHGGWSFQDRPHE
jgi:drug/metabolite transporter (DMT)-like permease